MPNNNNNNDINFITLDNLNFYHQHGIVPIKETAEALANAETASESGANGLRYYNGNLQYSTETFSPVTPEGTENPSEQGWYELDGESYVLTEDTEVVSGKEYYTQEVTWETIQTGGGGGSGDTKDLGESCTTVFNADGSITETYSDRIKTTEFETDGTITETLSDLNGTAYATKTVTFNSDGSITESVTIVQS